MTGLPTNLLCREGSRTAGLNRVPVTTPAGSQKFAAKEKDDEQDGAGGDERDAQDGERIGHAKSVGGEVAEELVDFILHAYQFAMLVPAANIVALELNVRFENGILARRFSEVKCVKKALLKHFNLNRTKVFDVRF
jgi:hypothetical protein